MRLLPCPCAGAAARTSASKVAGRSLMRRPPGVNPFSPMLRRSDPASSNLTGSSPWHNPAPPAEYHPALIVDPRLDVEVCPVSLCVEPILDRLKIGRAHV